MQQACSCSEKLPLLWMHHASLSLRLECIKIRLSIVSFPTHHCNGSMCSCCCASYWAPLHKAGLLTCMDCKGSQRVSSLHAGQRKGPAPQLLIMKPLPDSSLPHDLHPMRSLRPQLQMQSQVRIMRTHSDRIVKDQSVGSDASDSRLFDDKDCAQAMLYRVCSGHQIVCLALNSADALHAPLRIRQCRCIVHCSVVTCDGAVLKPEEGISSKLALRLADSRSKDINCAAVTVSDAAIQGCCTPTMIAVYVFAHNCITMMVVHLFTSWHIEQYIKRTCHMGFTDWP